MDQKSNIQFLNWHTDMERWCCLTLCSTDLVPELYNYHWMGKKRNYVYIHIYTCLCVYAYIRKYKYVYVYTHVCVCIYKLLATIVFSMGIQSISLITGMSFIVIYTFVTYSMHEEAHTYTESCFVTSTRVGYTLEKLT